MLTTPGLSYGTQSTEHRLFETGNHRDAMSQNGHVREDCFWSMAISFGLDSLGVDEVHEDMSTNFQVQGRQRLRAAAG